MGTLIPNTVYSPSLSKYGPRYHNWHKPITHLPPPPPKKKQNKKHFDNLQF
jgi:hypothetical protein